MQIVLGIHAVEAVVDKNPQRIKELLIAKGSPSKKLQTILDKARQQGISIQAMPKEKLDKRAPKSNHQGVIAICTATKTLDEHDLKDLLANTDTNFFLILDGIQDPHNLGACLRTADAAGVTAVIVPRDKSAGMSETVCKVASGAAESIPLVQVTNLARTMQVLKDAGVWLYGFSDQAKKSLFDTKLTGTIALVMGQEGEGMRPLTAKNCDHLCYIPMHGTVSSLNVSVATGVALFEAVRQRKS